MTASANELVQVGDEIPSLVLEDERGTPVNLRAVAADATLILFFYPKDNGMVCRTQACAIRDSWPLLRAEGIEVFGVNPDSAQSHQAFRTKFDLPFPLLVDENAQLARAFGFDHPWARTGQWPVQRSTVIVDPGGRVRVILPKVKAASHFDLLRVNLGLAERGDTADAT